MATEDVENTSDDKFIQSSFVVKNLIRVRKLAASFESNFLSTLRYAALFAAAAVLIASAGFLLVGLVNQIGKTEVKAEKVAIKTEDLLPSPPVRAADPLAPLTSKSTLDGSIRAKTLAIYRARFKAFQRPDDKITDDQVVDFIWTPELIDSYEALAGAGLQNNAGQDLDTTKSVMMDALTAVDAATQAAPFHKQLTGYHDAKKANVCTEKLETTSRIVPSWDSSATDCPGWYNSPVGCSSSRLIEEPVVNKVCEMKFPDGLVSPVEQFALSVRVYSETAKQRIEIAKNQAGAETLRNQLRKDQGKERMSLAVMLFGGFLGIMFLYLFVALERHHRSLRMLIKQAD